MKTFLLIILAIAIALVIPWNLILMAGLIVVILALIDK
jgi:hypothetical protein